MRHFRYTARITLPKKNARVISPAGKHWTPANIGNALAGREIAQHPRELGTNTRGPAPLTKRDRSRFLSALDTIVQVTLRHAARGPRLKTRLGWPLPRSSPKPALGLPPLLCFQHEELVGAGF